jgi:predicted MFS family arabinose efflux permease
MLLILPRYMPAGAGRDAGESLSYHQLLRSLPALFPRYPALRMSAALGGLVFAAFSGFWAMLAFHLTQQPIGLGSAAIGLFGIAAVPGALAARYSGRMSDRWGPTAVNAVSLTSVALALALFLIAGDSLVALVVGCNLLGYGTTSGQIANQVRVFTAGPDVRARLNTLYMFSVFAGGAAGTAVAGVLFTSYGWSGAIGGGFGFLGLAVVVLALHARGTRRQPADSTVANDADSAAGTRHSGFGKEPDAHVVAESPIVQHARWADQPRDHAPGTVRSSGAVSRWRCRGRSRRRPAAAVPCRRASG